MKSSVVLSLILCCFFSINAYAQNTTLSGRILDNKSKKAIEMASIRIMNAKDSAYVTGVVTDEKGDFSIALKPAKYIVKVTLLGYKERYVTANARANLSLGTLYLDEDNVLLNEAVVEAKAIEIQVKGDTVEYNADSYKTQPSAVVEDLLKKMPGVEIDADGKITVNGKEIKKILVDGKEFFSDDPKVASKNLPASMVNKLQVLDRKSDMTQMTGFDDGNEETVINLTVKAGMKQGVFGNGYAGYGSKDRYETNGMVNYMRNNTQVTAIGGTNNTNNAGFTDLASSMGSNNRPRGVNFGGNNGVAKTTNGGFNFATDYGTKFKWGGNIRYGSTNNDVTSKSNTSYSSNNPRSQLENAKGNNIGDNFNTSLRFEWAPDSLTKIIFTPSVQYNKNSSNQESDFENTFAESAANISNNKGNTLNYSDGNSTKLNGNLDVSRQLNKAGRVLSFSVSGGVNDGKSDGYDYSFTNYYNDVSKNETLDQIFAQKDKGNNWRAFVSYVEPIGRSNFLQLTYNIRNNHSETDKITHSKDNVTGEYTILDEDYSRNVKNDFLNQNVSLAFKAVRPKYNYTLGAGLEPSSSKTDIYIPSEGEKNNPRRNFLSFAPSGQFNYLWDKRHTLRITYNGTTNQPSALQLFDGIISRNAMDSTRGNPNLRPSFQNRLNVRYQKSNPENGSMMMLFGRFTHTSNDIVTITNETGSKREYSYANISGNMEGNTRFIYNTPLKNKKFSVNSMTYGRYRRGNTLNTGLKNTENNYTLQENVGLQYRSPLIDFSMRGNITYNKVANTLTTKNDRSVYNYGSFGSFTLYLPNDFTLDSDMQYSSNSGYGEGFKQNEWLWNASLAKQVFKNKAGTIRFKIYDILKQRSNISFESDPSYSRLIETNTINSYFMVHFIYKFQLFKGGVKRSDMEGDMQQPPFGRGGGGQGRGPMF